MAKIKTRYVCTECGAFYPTAIGKCPVCKAYGTMEKETIEEQTLSTKGSDIKAKTINEILQKTEIRLKTGIGEFDRVYGDGIVNDSVNTIAAPPGAGKTTLLLQVAIALANQDKQVLYATAEESETQIKNKCLRLFGYEIADTFHIISTKFIENIIDEAKRLDVKLLVVDSNKAVGTIDANIAGSRPGSPSQMLIVMDKIVEFCKADSKKPRLCFIIAQLTKDDSMAGSREFEHGVDSCAYLDCEDQDGLRILRTEKNRFAEIETGIFMMGNEGLISIDNPNEFFVTEREKSDQVPGVSLTVIKEGTRPIIAEIESLVTKSFLPYPTRIATCLKKDNLNILLSIITEIMKIDMSQFNVIINTTGGLKLSNKSSDLAIIMSVLSCKQKLVIPNEYVFLAEVGLTGELKKIQGIERRIKDLERMGYKKVFIAKNNLGNIKDYPKIQVVECKNIKEAWTHACK